MPALGNDYQNAKPMDDFTPIPVGDYKAVITESEVKQTKAGDGQYLNLRVEIIEGEYSGRIVFVILNLWNPNPKAVEIANRELATIVAAVGKPGAQNSEELHNIPMTIKVGLEQGKPWVDTSGVQHDGEPKNKIKNYLPYAAPVTTQGANGNPITVQTKPAPLQGNVHQGATTSGTATPPINPATGLPYKLWENWPGKNQ
jgi:hypothetical protein